MTTAEELEKFKEPGKFELLATAVLCKAETEYRAILHTGMNAKGQTKKSPVDGFCRVPGSIPPHFVLVEHTVEQNLEKKWLFDHRTVKPAAKGRRKQLSESDDGDLLKAGHLARSIETEFPDAKFTVVLTTNQGLKPDFCLQVEKKAQELEISVDFWDRSRIARFLDTAREGQWLRKEYLGIAAEMLSDDLLRDLCYKSLDEYKKQFITNPDQWVSRQIDQQVERGIDNQSYSIQLLIGNSGSGKSAAAYQTGKKYLEADGYSLWLSENVLTASDSLTSALNKVLHDLYPSLMPDAGREALLIESMGYLLNNNAEPFEIFWEAYYAEIIGQAIIKYPQNEEFLRELCTKLPLSLLEGIRYFTIPKNQYHQAIYRTLQNWVNFEVFSGLVPESILDTFCWKLIEIDSPLIINITEKFPKYRPVMLARIRNGCTISGVNFCMMENQHCFAPLINDRIRDQVVEQAKYNYKEKILDEIQQILKSSNITDDYRAGTLTLAGFLEFSELENEILICWQLIDNKTQFLPNAIWAASQCCGDNPEKLLDPLIEFWAELPDQKNDYGESWKDWFIHELSGFLPRYIRSHVLEYLIYQANKYESLRQYIAYFCQFIDTPTAVEFVVKSMAEIERNLKGKGSVLPWMPDAKNLSRESLNHLFYLLDSPDSDDFIKQNISQLLPVNFEPIPIDELREKYPNSFLFYNAVQKYIKSGDFRFLPDLLRLLTIDYHWFYIAHGLWCNEIQEITENYLKSFQNDIPQVFFQNYLTSHQAVANFLTKIPPENAESILDKYWDFLGFSNLFIQTALYIATPKTLNLVDKSLNKVQNDTPVFNRLFPGLGEYSYKFLYKGWTLSSGDILYDMAPEKLEILSPYINYFSELAIWKLADNCQRIRKVEGGRKYLLDKLDEQMRRRFYPSEQELLADLDEYEAQDNGQHRVSVWLDKFDKRNETKTNALKLIDSWLALKPNLKRFEIAATCISIIGTRQNNALHILDKYEIEGLPDEIERIKASTRFAIYRRTLD